MNNYMAIVKFSGQGNGRCFLACRPSKSPESFLAGQSRRDGVKVESVRSTPNGLFARVRFSNGRAGLYIVKAESDTLGLPNLAFPRGDRA